MKATGIIRRIDDLGRVVIPKDIRNNMNLREGDPLEIFIENDAVVFKKCQPDEIKLDTINLERFLEHEEYSLSEDDCQKLRQIISDIKAVKKRFYKGE